MDYKKAIDLLELNIRFLDEELQKNYKNLAKKYHPDNGATGDENMFMAIKEAYEFLFDSKNRKEETNASTEPKGDSLCPMCNGNGWRRGKIKTARGYIAQKVKCSFCNGTGRK